MPAPALAAKLKGLPHVWHIRDSFQEFKALWSGYRRYITGLSSRVICVSNAIAAQFRRVKHHRDSQRVPLDEFPADLDELRMRFREKYRLGNSLVIGCVGRINCPERARGARRARRSFETARFHGESISLSERPRREMKSI
jgi:hypothetical protein